MENYLLIENKGELSVQALILMGASSKRDDNNKIGFFGSGNKYALAVMLRLGIPIRIFSGETEITVTTKEVDFRGLIYGQIIINGVETSLTTDMGPEWTLWMAIREWVSNSMDEGGNTIVSETQSVQARDGFTRFYIEHTPEVVDIINNWGEYFSFDREDAIIEAHHSRLYPNLDIVNQSLTAHRRGIKCYSGRSDKALYTYDMADFPINESRVISDMWSARGIATNFLAQYATEEVALKILQNAFKSKTWENSFSWNSYDIRKLNDCWKDAIGVSLVVVGEVGGFYSELIGNRNFFAVSKSLALTIKHSFPEVIVYGIADEANSSDILFKKAIPTPKAKSLLKKAIQFLELAEYEVKAPVEVATFQNENIMGLSSNGKIYLSTHLFEKGLKEVVTVLIEENEHDKTKMEDNTREFQNHIFGLLVCEMEARTQSYL